MRDVRLAVGGVYHIYGRGIEKREVFLEDSYYARFVSLLQHYLEYDYPYSLLKRRLEDVYSLGGKQDVLAQLEKHRINPPIKILSFCLMPNHYHLTLEQMVEHGIASFMHRLGTGYTNYFNIRHERTGRLFESTYKAVLVESEEQLLHLTRYQHLNPRSLGLDSPQELVDYSWSSLSTYLGNEQFPFVDPKMVLSTFKEPESYLEFVLGKPDEYEALRLQEVAVDDDFGWFLSFRDLAKERRHHLRERYFGLVP